MKNIIFTFAFLCILALNSFAQFPHAINFQAIARDANGDVMISTDIMIRLTVIDGSASGTEVYQELRALTTNDYGSFSFQIGRDANFVTIGTFDVIDWNSGAKFLKIDYDPTNQFNWDLTLGTIEFVSVPYALSAETVSFIDASDAQDGDILVYNSTTGMFEPQQIAGTNYTAGTGILISGTTISNTGDLSNTNEIQTLSLNTNILSLSNGGGDVTIPSSHWTSSDNYIYFNSGDISIGTNSSSSIPHILQVNTSTGKNCLLLTHSDYGEQGATLNFDSYGNLELWNYENQGIEFATNNIQRIKIDNSGNLGVGTSEPTSKLQVVGLPEYADNAAALAAGLTVGAFYRTGDILKVVH